MTTMELLVAALAAIVLTAITAFIVIAAVRMWGIGVGSSPEGQDETVARFDGYFDKFGNPVAEGDVLSDGTHAYCIYYNADHSQIEAYSPTVGYLHNLTVQDAAKLERIGRTLEMDGRELISLYVQQGTAYFLDFTSKIIKK